ncbi:MAG: hypothetical protein ACOYOB_21525 [Myxococcota bacterium]
MKTIMAPLVHLNGTSGEQLAECLHTAARKIGAAIEAIHETAPHARDYYALRDGVGAFERARDEHAARVVKMRAVLNEVERLHRAVENREAGELPDDT